MSNNKQKKVIEFLANVKKIQMRNLVSGDKEVAIDLRVVGKDIEEANKLADLEIDKQVKVIAEE